MTYAAVPALAADARPRRPLGAAAGRRAPTTRCWRRWPTRPALTVGMGMTEKQGGSDVRANTTRRCPSPAGRRRRDYRLTGHKWFCSAPMSDAFLVLAQADAGDRAASCCRACSPTAPATRSASSGSRTSSATAPTPRPRSSSTAPGRVRVGEEGRGVRTIIEMVSLTRLDCVARLDGRRCAPALARARAPRPAPQRVRGAAGRPAADAQRARRPGAGARGRDGAGDAPGRTPSTRARTTSQRARRWPLPCKYWVCKRTAPMRRRGAGVPGRQRLRRGVGPAAALPRGAAELASGRAPATSTRSTSCAP